MHSLLNDFGIWNLWNHKCREQLDKFLAVALNVKKKSLLKNRSELSFMGKNLRFFLCSWKESSNWQTFPRVATGILIGRACWNCWFEVDFFRLSSMLGGAICNFWEFLGNSFEESVHGKLFFLKIPTVCNYRRFVQLSQLNQLHEFSKVINSGTLDNKNWLTINRL